MDNYNMWTGSLGVALWWLWQICNYDRLMDLFMDRKIAVNNYLLITNYLLILTKKVIIWTIKMDVSQQEWGQHSSDRMSKCPHTS